MFKPLVPSDYSELLPYFDHQVHRLCYYSLSAFICWNHHVSHPVWATNNDMLIIGMRYEQDTHDDYLYLPLAHGRLFSPTVLRDLALDCGFKRFQFVPGDYVNSQDSSELSRCFDVVEDPDFADYIYNTEDLANLKGNKYSKKRNLINQFLKSHVDPGRVDVRPMTGADIPECLDFLNTWSRDRQVDPTSDQWAAMEMKATENVIVNIEDLGYSGLVLRIDGDVKAFGMGSKLTDALGGFNFEKAAPEIKGLYQYLDQQCVRMLFSDVPFINKECDMGEPGLRQAKRSYHPVSMIKSFELSVK